MPKAITVTVEFRMRPGMEVIGRQELSEMIGLNRKAEGCRDIVIHRDLKDPGHFLTVSHWDSMDQFMKLLGEPHIKTYADKSKKLLQQPFEVVIWEVQE